MTPTPPPPSSPRTIPLLPAIAATAGAGALLLAISQFMTLYNTRSSQVDLTLGTGSVGSAHSYALLLVAVLAAGLGVGVMLARSRVALLGVGALGLLSLLVSLTRDLSDARAHGLHNHQNHYIEVRNVVAGGLYVEVAGALLLLIAAVGGFLLWGPPVASAGELRRRVRRPAADAPGRS